MRAIRENHGQYVSLMSVLKHWRNLTQEQTPVHGFQVNSVVAASVLLTINIPGTAI